MSAREHDVEKCRRVLVDGMARRGVEVVVSISAPIVKSPYEEAPFTCPHGVTFWMEPTTEQRIQWAKDGVR